jgi:hypothetical protein
LQAAVHALSLGRAPSNDYKPEHALVPLNVVVDYDSRKRTFSSWNIASRLSELDSGWWVPVLLSNALESFLSHQQFVYLWIVLKPPLIVVACLRFNLLTDT